MVRGDPSCPNFCKGCITDCKCENTGCDTCHTCSYNSLRNNGYLITNCNVVIHDCNKNTNMRRYEERFVAKLFQFPTLFSTDMVDVYVGTGPHKISRRVPKNALMEHSQYFKVFFDFEEKSKSSVTTLEETSFGIPATTEKSGNKIIRLETEVDRPDAFDMFIQYIYWQDYQPSPSAHGTSEVYEEFDFCPHVRVYILAERLQVDGLKDLALRKATEICAKLCKKVKSISKKTGEDKGGDESAQIVKIIQLIPEMVEVIYANTPMAAMAPVAKLTEELSAEDEAATGATTDEDSTNNVQEGKEEGSKPATVSTGMGCSTDPFRTLLAAVSASCLGKLKVVPIFGECLREIPDFAVDLVTRLLEVEPFGVDENGYMAI